MLVSERQAQGGARLKGQEEEKETKWRSKAKTMTAVEDNEVKDRGREAN